MEREKRVVVNELHKPVRHRFPRRSIIIKGLDDLWQADLVEMIPYNRENKGYKYILMVIDTFSKYLWARPVKNKTGEEVTKAMKDVLKERKPDNLQTDHGKEFYNPSFQSLMQQNKINHYSTFSNIKASIVERVNRTIKTKMWKEFSMQGSYKWLNLLPSIVRDYNKTVHRTTRMKPQDVNKKVEQRLQGDVYSHLKQVAPVHFKVGDHVRISKYKSVFAKGYQFNWTTEIFVIDEVQRTNPTTYLLRDYRKEPVLGGFYREELQKIKYPDVYLVEKVLRRQGNRAYVRWLGFGNEHNSWITVK